MSKRVYIINKSGHVYKKAEQFGELVYLSVGLVPDKYAVASMYREMAEILKDSSPEDYILMTGLTIQNIIAASIFSYLHGRINVLLFKNGSYVSREIMLGALLPTGDEE